MSLDISFNESPGILHLEKAKVFAKCASDLRAIEYMDAWITEQDNFDPDSIYYNVLTEAHALAKRLEHIAGWHLRAAVEHRCVD